MFINLTVILFCKKSCIVCTFIYIMYLQALPRIIMHINYWLSQLNAMERKKLYFSLFLGRTDFMYYYKKGKKNNVKDI